MSSRVIVVGGGLAGISAAVALAERNVPVLLLESRPRLGGRASSFVDATTGELIDNCQHVSLGCCLAFDRLAHTIGIDSLMQREKRLNFVAPNGQITSFAAHPFLPAPLHLFPAFCRLPFLSWGDVFSLARGVRALVRSKEDRLTIGEFLRKQGQSEKLMRTVWETVLVSALSESLDRISVPMARKVFRDAFLARRDFWEVLIPSVPLDVLYGEKLTGWFEEHGVQIRLKCGVEKILTTSDPSILQVQLRSGEILEASDVVVAVPQNQAVSLFPPDISEKLGASRWDAFETAPITSVHLWHEKPWMKLRHAVFVGKTIQWVFNRSLLLKSPGNGLHSTQVVISDSRKFIQNSSESNIQLAVEELATAFPQIRDTRLIHARVITEHRAVFSPTPSSEDLRPEQRTPIPGLYLAGDWTKTGWPSTMEGAVRSGERAAAEIHSSRSPLYPQRGTDSSFPLTGNLVPPTQTPEPQPNLLYRILLGK